MLQVLIGEIKFCWGENIKKRRDIELSPAEGI